MWSSETRPIATPSDDKELVERLRAKVFAGPAEDQRLKLVAEEAATRISTLSSREAVLREAGNRLSFAAQISGGTAGRDEGLVAAIEGWERALSDGGRDG